MMRKAILAATLFLAGCGGGGGGKTGDADDLKFRRIAPDIFTVVIDPHADVTSTGVAIRKHCAARPVCTVLGWTDAGSVARTFPLTDREEQALAVRYDQNAAAGLDDLMWDCILFQAAKAPCLPKA